MLFGYFTKQLCVCYFTKQLLEVGWLFH